MQKIQNKTMAILIALLLITSMSAIFVVLPNADAQTTTRKTYCFLGATPNPVGVEQMVHLSVGITLQLQNVAMGWEGLTVTVTKPDSTTTTLGPIKTDSTGGGAYNFIPDQIGNYTLQAHFPQQITTTSKYNTASAPVNTTMLASDSPILTLVVQQEPIPYPPNVPLPTEYWTNPIYGQNWQWATIAGNWLQPQSLFNVGFAPFNQAPKTGHLLWSKPYSQNGGIVGGTTSYSGSEVPFVYSNPDGNPVQYNEGAAYEGKFQASIIINGILYYNLWPPIGSAGATDQGITAVDLHTGQQLWTKTNMTLAFGQILFWNSYNMEGAFSYLWQTSGTTWNAYDPSQERGSIV